MWGAGAMVAAVLGLTAYSALSHHDDNHNGPHAQQTTNPVPTAAPNSPSSVSTPSVAPTYTAPGAWTDPQKWIALPHGTQTNPAGDQTGFQSTTDGAVAMLVASSTTNVQGTTSTVDRQLAIYHTYVAAADQNPTNEQKVHDKAVQTDAQERSDLGLPASGPLPSGAFVRSTVVGVKVLQASPNEVTAWVLTKVMQKAGELQPEKDSFTVSVLGAAWENGDWKLSTKASLDAVTQAQAQDQPGIAAPGDAQFNSYGWTAIRQAS